MKQLKLRGYVTSADCGGSIQGALDLAAELDINKVILTGQLTASAPLVIPGGMYLVLQDCTLRADLVTAQQENYSFRQQFITIEADQAKVEGNIHIFNTHHVTIRGLEIAGKLTCEYTLWGNLQNLQFTQGGLQLGRGCGNFIVQNLKSHVPACIDGSISCGKIVPGVKPDISSIVLQDSVFETAQSAVQLGAAEDCGVMNIQVDHIKATATAVQVGCGKELPEHLFMNLTFTDLDAPVKVCYQNKTKHVYEK